MAGWAPGTRAQGPSRRARRAQSAEATLQGVTAPQRRSQLLNGPVRAGLEGWGGGLCNYLATFSPNNENAVLLCCVKFVKCAYLELNQNSVTLFCHFFFFLTNSLVGKVGAQAPPPPCLCQVTHVWFLVRNRPKPHGLPPRTHSPNSAPPAGPGVQGSSLKVVAGTAFHSAKGEEAGGGLCRLCPHRVTAPSREGLATEPHPSDLQFAPQWRCSWHLGWQPPAAPSL